MFWSFTFIRGCLMRFISIMALLSFCTVLPKYSYSKENEKFAVYYSDKVSAKSLKDYDLLVLDSRHHPSLQELSETGKILLGYVSLGEVEKTSPFHGVLKKENALLQQNANWKSYGVDIRKPIWQKAVIEVLVPGLLRDGFDGIFIDTLDTPLDLERREPKKYAGTEDAVVNLIKAIRMHFPNIKIMVNRGYEVLPRIAPYIDMELGESVRHTYNFDKKSYGLVSDADYKLQVKWLQDAKRINNSLKIYTLDYADKNDSKKISEIYQLQRANGFIPYVTTISLNEIVDERPTTEGVN